MTEYKDLSGDSGVKAFEIGNDYIKVQFTSGKILKYTYNSSTKTKVDNAKKLAVKGEGLNSFINDKMYDDYVK